ncbi:MAG TPA: LLM class flavin-dependent oxidoreductase [Mycobacteriales bacterium]|jgi:alkanesulfonate monooxygenase SsuD/methylene tetrahydromethanopterin reductase-like flavin-dependent oxidoreductase (luciferase family)|nr:LLM class flavin-dependent oxidoreductase [Mycobacteriales bacterium]
MSIGLSAAPQLPPRRIPDLARQAEAAGFDQVWLAEDCFFAGGIAAASAALAATRTITVGLGILPAVARNAAFTAMEVAALAELYPGRVVLGLGHGMTGWMKQVGAYPRSPLTALGEHLDAVRALLAGHTVTVHGDHVRLDGVGLDHPPSQVPPVLAGVRGPRSLELSGARADGTILAWPVAPAYVRHARARIDAGRVMAGRTDHHEIVAGTPIFLDADIAAAERAAGASLAAELLGTTSRTHLEPIGIADDAAALVAAAGSPEELAARLPADWVDMLTVAGDPAQCAARIMALQESGVDTVIVGSGPDIDYDIPYGALLAALR